MADPYLQVFVDDWIADDDLDGLESIAAVGLWAEMMLRMQRSGGQFVLGGKPVKLADHKRVARYIRRLSGPEEARELLDLLAEKNVFSVGDDGTICFRRNTKYLTRPRRDTISSEVRAYLLTRDYGKCRTCASTERLEVDHIHPVVFGGTSALDNLQVLCRNCNQEKGPTSYARRRSEVYGVAQ
jgi:hypothetical protein